jgi:hypothetical protein
MADRYFYCNNPKGSCGDGAVNIMPIQGLDNHYYCTDPELPYRSLESCPPGYKLVDNASACILEYDIGTTATPTATPTPAGTTQPGISYTTPGSVFGSTSPPSYTPNMMAAMSTTTPTSYMNNTTRPNVVNQTSGPSPTPTRGIR